MVAKILKRLARKEILESRRGANGGYRLTRSDREVSIASIVEALEGPIGMVECIPGVSRTCRHEPRCPVKSPLQRLNAILRKTLESLTLRELIVSG
jgi:Rrf2 family protein